MTNYEPSDAEVKAFADAFYPERATYDPEKIRAALIAAARVRGDGWMPIESAPTDGSQFHGLVGKDAILMFWHPQLEKFISSFHRMTLADGMTFSDTGLNYKDHSPVEHSPTHWTRLALPAAPAKGEGE